MDNYEILCGITLNRVFGYEPSIARRLISRFGSPGAVFSQSPSNLDEAFGPYSKYRALICPQELEVSKREWKELEPSGCRFVCYGSKGYPGLLADCEDAPAGLYIRSLSPPEDLWKDIDSVSIVGTRDISPYGKEFTEKIVRSLSGAARRPTVVSGFAIGVDITAHLAALAFGLPTIAVLPVGIDSIYPWRHRNVAQTIVNTPGCALVTDFPPGTAPQPFNFLRRNRIIAGLSRATILAESKAKGGGTMTARLAAGYGREVFCLPGRIDDLRSEGCNRLIKEKIAEPITSLEALPEQLGLGPAAGSPRPGLKEQIERCYGGTAPESVAELASIALLIQEQRGITPEEICRTLQMEYGKVSAAVCLLESDGFICTDLLRRCCIDNKKV
ncbi:MAG: DNA-protecting protein DprA [Bacteroidales bacterium]|nr:DNA-protecting protein DprA [Bacteroidales bacterium]